MDQLVYQLLHHRWAHPAIDIAMAAVTLIAPLALFGLPIFVSRAGHRTEARALLGALAVAGGIAVLCQFLVGRPRPELTRWVLPTPSTPSFPSGHAALAFAAFSYIAVRWRKLAWIAGLMAIWISISRLFLGHHFVSDVAVGAVIGSSIGVTAYGLTLSHPTRPRWTWLLFPQLGLVIVAIVGAYLGLTRWEALMLPHIDKVLHFALFGALAFFLVGWVGARHGAKVLIALAVIAALEEVLQALSPARTFDLGDLSCTLSGIGLLGLAALSSFRTRPVEATIDPAA